MEDELRYRARCRVCGVLEGRRYVESGGRTYWVPEGESVPVRLFPAVVKCISMIFPRGEQPICSSCNDSRKISPISSP